MDGRREGKWEKGWMGRWERERGGCIREWEEWGRKEIGEGISRRVEWLILAHKQSGQSEVMES